MRMRFAGSFLLVCSLACLGAAPPSLDDLLARARVASGAPYQYHIVSRERESAEGRSIDVTSEVQALKYRLRRCMQNICSGFYFDGERSYYTNPNDTALPISTDVDGLQLTLRAIATYEFTSPSFRQEGGTLSELDPVMLAGKRCRSIAVAASRGASLDAIVDPESSLVVGVISDERKLAFEFRDQRKVAGKVTLPYEVWLNGARVDHFDDRSISGAPLEAPPGLQPAFASGSVTVGMGHIDRATNAPAVPCSIGGQRILCLLDTGNSGMSLSLEVAEKLGIEPAAGAFKITGIGQYVTGLAKAPALQIGGMTVPSAQYVVLHDVHPFGYDAVLGADLFAHARVSLDYARRTVTFAPSAAAAPPGSVPISFQNYIPVVTVRIGDQPVALSIDTGDESAINLAYDYYRAHPGLFHATQTVQVAGIGGTSEQLMGVVAQVQIGNLAVTNQRIGATKNMQPTASGHVGNGFLSHFDVTFDYAHDRVGLTARSGDASVKTADAQ
jgi:hypothetical protein